VLGGEVLTFTGTGFVSGETTVTIDNKVCAVTAVTATEIKCTAAAKVYVKDTPKLEMAVSSKGNVATMGKKVLYVSKWSDV